MKVRRKVNKQTKPVAAPSHSAVAQRKVSNGPSALGGRNGGEARAWRPEHRQQPAPAQLGMGTSKKLNSLWHLLQHPNPFNRSCEGGGGETFLKAHRAHWVTSPQHPEDRWPRPALQEGAGHTCRVVLRHSSKESCSEQ